eukprot:scaffold49131_cov31-Cyclotella_meneghiniana.AAC.1
MARSRSPLHTLLRTTCHSGSDSSMDSSLDGGGAGEGAGAGAGAGVVEPPPGVHSAAVTDGFHSEALTFIVVRRFAFDVLVASRF